jgi:hypothetical protein
MEAKLAAQQAATPEFRKTYEDLARAWEDLISAIEQSQAAGKKGPEPVRT